MRKILIVLISLFFAYPFGWTQKSFFKIGTNSTEKLSKVLSKQVRQSYESACTIQQCYKASCINLQVGPSKHLRSPIQATPTHLYPQATFLKPENLSDYFLAQNNKEIVKILPLVQEREKIVLNSISHLKTTQEFVNHPHTEDMNWLASQITPNISTFLLGEVHYKPEIQENIVDLLSHLRAQNPTREIILFTEFLPQDSVWGIDIKKSPFEVYTKVWKSATDNNILTIGLEPNFVEDNDVEMIYHSASSRWDFLAACYHQNIWASLEGLRIRNENWIQTLNKYRTLHPDALFIVYAGSGHLIATEPYSIATYFEQQNTFTAALFPDYDQIADTYQVSNFDKLTEGTFDERVLFFKDPTSIKITGFNTRIKINSPID